MPIGVPRGTLRRHQPANKKYTIYSYGDSLTGLWSGLDEVEDAEYAQGDSASVDGHTVRRYPGDPGYQRGPHTRKSYINRGRSGSSTTPGNRFWIEVPIAGPGLTQYKTYQFTYTGEWASLLEDALEALTPGVKIRRESSTAKEVPTPAGP